MLTALAVLLLGGGIALPLVLHQSDARQYADVVAESRSVRDNLRELEPRADAAELLAHLRFEIAADAVERLEVIGGTEAPALTEKTSAAVAASAKTVRDALATPPIEPDDRLRSDYDSALVAEDSSLPTSPFALDVDLLVSVLDVRPGTGEVRTVPDAEIGAAAIAEARAQLDRDRAEVDRVTGRYEAAVATSDDIAESLAASLEPLQNAAASVPEQAVVVTLETFAATEEHQQIAESVTALEGLAAERGDLSDADRALRVASGLARYVSAADAARALQEGVVDQAPGQTPTVLDPQVPIPPSPDASDASADGPGPAASEGSGNDADNDSADGSAAVDEPADTGTGPG